MKTVFMQDLAISAGYRIRVVAGTYDASGNVMVNDVRRAVWIWGADSANQFRLAMIIDGTTSYQLPSRTDLATTVAANRTYHREQFGGVPPGQLVAKGTALDTVVIFIAEYDASVDAVVSDLLKGGSR